MKKRILSLVLALATLLALCACGGGDVGSEGGGALPVEDGFSLYSDEGLGYCFLYPEGRAVGYTEEDGAYIYCGEAGAAPYVLVCRTDGKTTADKYFDSFTDTMLDSFASVASRNIYSVEVDGRELYMTRYVCENGGQRLVIDRYLELRDGFYLQYTSLSEAEKSLDTELYYAIYTLRAGDTAYVGAYSEKLTVRRNEDTGITLSTPDMLETNELYVGFLSSCDDAVLLAVYIDEDDLGAPIYNRRDFIDRAAASPGFFAGQLGADSASFSEGTERSMGGRSFYCYPMAMTSGGQAFSGELCLANAQDSGCYLVCYAVKDGYARFDKLTALLTQCADSFDISK